WGGQRPRAFGPGGREERPGFRAVPWGRLEPAWSPDGRWIAGSMRGDIWKIPAAGGEAIQLTTGPAYHYEPAWSPDGSRIAFSFDMPAAGNAPGNLRIGAGGAKGGHGGPPIPARGGKNQPGVGRDGQGRLLVSGPAGR